MLFLLWKSYRGDLNFILEVVCPVNTNCSCPSQAKPICARNVRRSRATEELSQAVSGPGCPTMFKVRKLLRLDHGLHTIPVAQTLCIGFVSFLLFRKKYHQLILICSSFAYSKKTPQFYTNCLFSSIVPTWNINRQFWILILFILLSSLF